MLQVNDEQDTYYLERTIKTQLGAPNAWNSKEPLTNVRTPARNIIRTLPGIKGRARTLGNQPTKNEKRLATLSLQRDIREAIKRLWGMTCHVSIERETSKEKKAPVIALRRERLVQRALLPKMCIK
ncbi:hypothetical protein J6590_048477 [Homalodisca vitripennis]|nr:hypothetical protein J6590_048477 [Homalodisca vitripennis]